MHFRPDPISEFILSRADDGSSFTPDPLYHLRFPAKCQGLYYLLRDQPELRVASNRVLAETYQDSETQLGYRLKWLKDNGFITVKIWRKKLGPNWVNRRRIDVIDDRRPLEPEPPKRVEPKPEKIKTLYRVPRRGRPTGKLGSGAISMLEKFLKSPKGVHVFPETYHCGGTNSELAQLVGKSASWVSRALKWLRQDGLIKIRYSVRKFRDSWVNDRRITIGDGIAISKSEERSEEGSAAGAEAHVSGTIHYENYLRRRGFDPRTGRWSGSYRATRAEFAAYGDERWGHLVSAPGF